ncbi:MAG: hypothetical protein Q8M19_04335 [Reyranella sp.]|nr:hypothetical protein [Reyranella sp.]
MSDQAPAGDRRVRIASARLDAFLQHLTETGDVSVAAERVGLHRSTLYKHKSAKPAFARRWTEALEMGLDRLQDHAVNRATVGLEKPVWHRGEQVGAVRQPDNRLLQFLLKAHRPEVYDRGKAGSAALPFDLIRRMADAEKRMAVFEAEEKTPKKKPSRKGPRHG